MILALVAALGFAEPPDERTSCGAVALFLLLQAHGQKPKLGELRVALPHTEAGASVAELVEVGRRYSSAVTARRLSATNLSTPDPRGVVAHLESTETGGVGHFVFIRQNGDRWEALEPVGDSVLANVVDRHFLERFSGWIVTHDNGERFNSRWAFAMLAVGGGLGWLAVRSWHRRHPNNCGVGTPRRLA